MEGEKDFGRILPRSFEAIPRALVFDVLAPSALMVLPGLACGLAAARAATQVLSRSLFEIPPTDTIAYAAGAFCMASAALAASAWPALRASRVDPVVALRHD